MANSALSSQILNSFAHGQCQFVYVSTSVTRLNRYNGRYLMINGTPQEIPAAGVDLSNASLASNDTTYMVYAYMSGATMTLEASATAHATDATTGVEIKSGDATRTLVGMARKTGGNFASSVTQRFSASWFNRKSVPLFNTATTAATTTPTAYAPVYFLSWADEAIVAGVNISAYNSTGNDTLTARVLVDGSASGSDGNDAANNGAYANSACEYSGLVTEGYHYVSVEGTCSGINAVGSSEKVAVTIRA